MPLLDRWRPVALSRALGAKPLAVELLGRRLVLFRAGGRIGALEDRCPHRGMRLSRGAVRDGRLTCPYHGWSFCPAGTARSPATPSLRLTHPALETAERHGLVWLREQGGEDELPDESEEGLAFVHSLDQLVEAPLASVLDNFTEVEHTGHAHWQFGYDPKRLQEIEVATEWDDDAVRTVTRGPQRPLWPSTRLGFGIGEGMELVCEWSTSFAPTCSRWQWHWRDPTTGERRGRRFKAIAYFNEVTAERTRLLTYYFWSPAAIDRFGFAILAKPLIRWATRYEVGLDAALIEGLADRGRGLPPTGASRFDAALLEQRRRLAAAQGSVPEISE